MIKWLSCLLILFAAVGTAQSAPILTEGFDDITTLAGSGWTQINNSALLGTTGWFQGNTGVFSAQAGAGNAYVAANFNNAYIGGGNISNWLISPELNLTNGETISFFTRTETGAPFADRLELRLSTSGSSSDVGTTDASVGDFTNLLLTINPALDVPGYPEDWAQFAVTLNGFSGPGRFAFRYFVTDTSVNGDYIGIDTVSVNTTSVPEPSTILLLLLGMGAIPFTGLLRRFTARK
jgi:hypothetical protein